MKYELTLEELKDLEKRIAELEEESRRIQKELAPLRGEWYAHTLLKRQLDGGDGYLPRENRTVVRTSRGLTVNGTRLTLYDLRFNRFIDGDVSNRYKLAASDPAWSPLIN